MVTSEASYPQEVRGEKDVLFKNQKSLFQQVKIKIKIKIKVKNKIKRIFGDAPESARDEGKLGMGESEAQNSGERT